MQEFAGVEDKNLVYERFFSVNLDLLCIADTEGTFIKVNKSWESILGYSIEELEGVKFLDYVHPDDIEATLNAMASLSEQKQVLNFTNRYKSKDGSYRYIEWRSHPYGNLIYAAARDITDRIEKQREIEEKEKNFQNFFEAIDDLIFVATTEGNILHTNKAVKEKLGYSEEELYMMHILNVHPKIYRTEVEATLTDMFKGIKDYCPLPLEKKDGGFLPVETRVWLGEWCGNKCLYGISKDLSKQQAALEKFYKLFENNPALMAVSSISNNKFEEVNSAFLKKLGYTREEIIGKNSVELGLFIEDEKQEEATVQLEKTGKIKDVELKLRKKDGSILYGLFYGEIIDNQGQKSFLTVMIDITQQRKDERELKEAKTSMKAILDNIPFLAWLKDKKGIYLEVNKEFEKAFGKNAEEIIGYTDYDICPTEVAKEYVKDDFEILRSGKKKFTEVMTEDSQGLQWLENFKTPIFDTDGGVIGITGISRNITERKKLELEIVKAKEQAEAANVMKSQFLANMSHEIRTPMNGILGFLDLLQRTNLSADQKDYIREAKGASEMLLYLINDILDLSKIEAGKLVIENTIFKIRTAIEDAVSIIVPKAEEKNIELHTMVKSSVPEEVIGDPARLRQVLNNLISNAIKFTDKGEINIIVDCIKESDGKALISLEVKDTGIGIRQKDIKKLFTPFTQADASTTRRFGGTGLGLAISKELVKLMHGDISMESEFGKGSTFKFTVLLEISKKLRDSNVFKEIHGVNVLVVDDNENNRKIVRSYLEDAGCKIFEAEGADKAITTILTNSNNKNKIDIAIVDFQMPVMNGHQLATTLKAIPFAKDVKLILLTSAAQKGDASVAKEHGFLGYLSKPIRRDELLNCVSIVLGLKKEIDSELQIVTRYSANELKENLQPTILLVEDNEMNQKVVTTMLKHNNITCDIAIDGSEAVKAVAKKNYDVVFMDCQMPVMDGYESTARIREMEGDRKHTIIIAMTANAMEGDRKRCIEAGMDDYISKPINFDIMFSMIEANTKNKKQSDKYFSLIDDNIDRFVQSTGLSRDEAKGIFMNYMEYLPKILEQIREAIDNNDFEKLGKLAHQLKGSAGNLMINSVYELAMELEDSALKEELEKCQSLLIKIQRIF